MHSGTMAADADFDPDTRPAHLTKGGSSRVDVPESASTATAGLSTDMHGRSDENLEWTADPDFVSGVGDAPRQSSSLLVDGRSKHAAPQDPSADMDWGSEHDIVPAALESPVPNEHLALVAASTGTALHDPDADMGLGATDSDMAMQEPAPDSTASPWASRLDREAALSLTHSAVDVVAQGVPLGFGVARACTGLGFAAASACLRTGAVCSAAAGGVGMAAALTGVDMAIGAAGKATLAGQSFAEDFTKYSLQAAKAGLVASGAREGRLLPIVLGPEVGEAIRSILDLGRRFAEPISVTSLPALVQAAAAWGTMQRAAALFRPERPACTLPEHSERWLRLASAPFGAAWLAGLVDRPTLAGAVQAAQTVYSNFGVDDASRALACAGVKGHVEVLLYKSLPPDVLVPRHMISVDHELGYVVVALAGTSSIGDVVTDLVCEPITIHLGGLDGLAHGGMWRAAERLAPYLQPVVQQGLAALQGPPRVMLCGHSLGAGVAALLTGLWRDECAFAPGTSVQCMAFACPQVLDARMAAALRPHVCTLVAGGDVVPRLSLATATDLRDALLHVSAPQTYGLSASYSPAAIQAAATEDGGLDRMAAMHDTVRHLTCTASGRLYPAGQVIGLAQEGGGGPCALSHADLDQLLMAPDMLSLHLPFQYLGAIQAAAAGTCPEG